MNRAAWCDCCGQLVATSDIRDGICPDCRDGDERARRDDPTDAEIDRALDRMDYLFGPGWLKSGGD
jgi:Zn finger protein HypA/HybF involved in hydrogenase expression